MSYQIPFTQSAFRLASPVSDEIAKAFLAENIDGMVDFVDLPVSGYWDNDRDTLVVMVKDNFKDQEARIIAALGSMATELHADEFHYKLVNGKVAVRIWWD